MTVPPAADCEKLARHSVFVIRIPNRGFETTKGTKGTKRERENSNRVASKSL